MRRFLTMAFLVLVMILGVAQAVTTVRAAGGSCTCPKNTPVCCRNCNGTFAYCARSYAFCPECPAP
jgi:hypothetical protein